jgi:RNA polymerase sigma-70 factor, ECF subfamily
MLATPQRLDAVTELLLAEQETLRRLARRLARCEADADDLVQNTLLRAYRARDRFVPGTSIRAWLATILRRVFLTDFQRTKRRGLENDTDADDALERTAGSMPPSTCERSISQTELLERLDDPVKRALEHVPDVYRVPFLLSLVEDLTCAEIARRLRVPEGTVMSRIHRAREHMKRELVYPRGAKPAVPARRRAAAA